MLSRFRNWWLHLPYPIWLFSACKPFSPLCLVDDLAHYLFPMTFGFHSDDVALYKDTWISRLHDRSVEKYYRRKHPEYFDGE